MGLYVNALRVTIAAVIWISLISSCQSWAARQETKTPSLATEMTNRPVRKTSNWIKRDIPFGKWGDVLAISEDGSIAIAGEGTVLISSNDGESWSKLEAGKGSYRSTVDGGETSTSVDQLGTVLPSSVAIKDLCSVERGVLTSAGRLYLKTVCEHTSQLWSIPTRSPNESWNVLSFTYKTDPSDGVYSAGHNLTSIGDRVVIDTSLPTGPALLTTDDDGATWYPMWRGSASDTGVVGISFTNRRDGWMLQGDGALLRTNDGGQTWKRVSKLPRRVARNCNSLSFVDPQTGFIGGQQGLLLSTSDGGLTWKHQNSGTTLDLYQVMAANAKRVWAVGGKGIVLETLDGGSEWHTIDLGVDHDIRFGLGVNRGTAWVISGGSLFRSPKTGG